MNDTEILDLLGISDSDLRDYQAKYQAFYNGLNEGQQAFVAHVATFKDVDAAAEALHPEVSADELQRFFESRVPGAAPRAMCLPFTRI
ncbi:MAG: hypothetical protein ACKVYV_12925 [Limisphaerales bacterium]